MKNNSTLLHISNFAKLSGLDRKTLIFYDNIGLFKPVQSGDNGYRYYSYRQLDVITVIQILKELGMPLKEIQTQMKIRTPESIVALFSEQERKIDIQLKKLQSIKAMIESRTEGIRLGMEAPQNTVLVLYQKSVPILLSQPTHFNKSEVRYDMWQGFYEQLDKFEIPYGIFLGIIISKADFCTGKQEMVSRLYARPQNPKLCNDVIPEGYYLATCAHGDYGCTKEAYHLLDSYIAGHDIQVIGSTYEEYLLDEITCGNPQDYLVQIRVQIASRF